LEKTDEILNRHEMRLKAVNLRTLLPLLEAAAVESDEDMTSRWASLLASAADATNTSEVESSFIEILKQLPPSHAFVLDVFYAEIASYRRRQLEIPDSGVQTEILRYWMTKHLKVDALQVDIALDNLLRLNLVTYPTIPLVVVNGREIRGHVTSAGILCATALGQAFCTACGKVPSRNNSFGIPSDSVSNIFALGPGVAIPHSLDKSLASFRWR
jgi:hypothetical protein